MRRRRSAALALALALALAIGGVAGTASATPSGIETTSAAWADRTNASVQVAAGTWSTNTCTAYGNDGKRLATCTVTGITYFGWGDAGKQTRNYYIQVQAPTGARTVTFDVDLTTATGNGNGGSWSWKKAKVLSGGQFAPRDGWTCGEFPRVRGTGMDWLATTIYFTVSEHPAGSPTRCS